MIAALKYCGGCNPRYNRTAAVAELKSSLESEGIVFVPYKPEAETYDACVLVSGCSRTCISGQKFSNCRHLFKAAGREDFYKIKSELCALAQTPECAE